MAHIDELEARLAALEARIGPAPLAVPPVVIGELSDVPAPGSPIASQWAQEVTRRTLHRFATIAARDAAYPAATAGNGATCITLDSGAQWVVVAGVWQIPVRQLGSPWTALPLINSWVNYDASHPAQYRRIDGGDTIALRGLIKGGASGSTICTMPAGFRPSQVDESFVVPMSGGNALFSIFSDGHANVTGAGVTTFCYLAGIIYSTAA